VASAGASEAAALASSELLVAVHKHHRVAGKDQWVAPTRQLLSGSGTEHDGRASMAFGLLGERAKQSRLAGSMWADDLAPFSGGQKSLPQAVERLMRG
jgi:hypothetical protein